MTQYSANSSSIFITSKIILTNIATHGEQFQLFGHQIAWRVNLLWVDIADREGE